ncbi:hypothetical protein RclHR1_10070006 [Rhizophagus clarus]|uniref:Uncharacterized protein n=1 Tax=Rhizophagus clarus TaxID=94130 RepID=A0A2Z6QER8_9GLOM|nr:hypothetical protein RclHR1_10070006 [Rhizophagus clarus]
MPNPLTFRLNVCSICLICLDCKICTAKTALASQEKLNGSKKKAERDYKIDFSHKPLTQKGATKQKVALETEFINWFFANASPHIELSPTPTVENKQLTQNETTNITNLTNKAIEDKQHTRNETTNMINLEDTVPSVPSAPITPSCIPKKTRIYYHFY